MSLKRRNQQGKNNFLVVSQKVLVEVLNMCKEEGLFEFNDIIWSVHCLLNPENGANAIS